MASLRTRRLVKLTALCFGPVALLTVVPPSSAEEPVDPTEFAPSVSAANTGELVSKGLSANTVLTSTSGKKLKLAVYGNTSSEGGYVTVSLTRGGEGHSWNYDAREDDLKIDNSGAGTLTLTSAQTGGRGELDLTFSPTDPATTQKCGGKVAYKSRVVKVTGIAQAKTETKSWGTVGNANKAITFKGKSRVSWSYDVTCPPTAHKCQKVTSWSASHSTEAGFLYISGWASGKKSKISGYRTVSLDNPEGASRSDWVDRSAPKPVLKVNGDTASLTAEGTTGSITIKGADPYNNSYSCRAGKTKSTQKYTSWSGMATNGSKAFTVKAQIFGSFKVPNDSSGFIGRHTY